MPPSRSIPTFLLLLALTHLFYYPTWDAGFVTDFTGLMERLEGQGIAGVLDSFGFPSLQPFLNLFLFLFVKGFGTAPLPWYLVFTTAHAINAFLVFTLGRRLFFRFGVSPATGLALGAALVFLLSPYQSEVVIWRVCFNFLLVTGLILGTLLSVVRYLETGRSRYLGWAYGLFLLSLFTFELALAVPLLTLAVVLFWRGTEDVDLPSGAWPRLVLPQWGLAVAWFGLNRLLLGGWVGHYGAEVHLRFVWTDIFSNVFKYLIKYLTFLRYWPHPRKEAVLTAISQPGLLTALVAGGLLALLLYLFFFRRLPVRIRLTGLFPLLALIALVPVINLYFNYLLYIENDRYGYLFSAFFALFLVGLLSHLPRPAFWGLLTVYLGVSAWLLHRTNGYWAESTVVYRGLLQDFNYYDRPEIFLLNLPDNLNGAVMFRDYSGSDAAFADALRYVKQQPFQGKLHEVVQYNLTGVDDGVSVSRDSTGALLVRFEQYGNWWWRRGLGAADTATDQYRFLQQDGGYRLEWKERPEEATLLYQTGPKWKEQP